MQEEIWKDITGFDGYQVSNLGRIKSLRFNRSKIMSQTLESSGYLKVNLRKNKSAFPIRVHQAVAIGFLKHVACGHKLVVNHIDYNRLNNNLNNLEVITHRDNTNRKHVKSTSKYTGVYWNKNKRKWQASININRVVVYLGVFSNEADAADAYNTALSNIKTEETK